MDPRPSVPFTDVGQLKTYLSEKVYSRNSEEAFAHAIAFYGVSSMDEMMAIPARTNSGELGTMGSCWFGMFPFVDMATQWVETDDVGLCEGGYALLFWGRWNGECVGPATLPNGVTIDLTGKSFRNLRYAYRLTFSPDTKKAILFEGLFDIAEWGRLMDSPAYATASAHAPVYSS